MVLPASHRVSVPCGTQDPAQLVASSPTGLSPCLVALPRAFSSSRFAFRQSYNPERRSARFRLFHFRSPLLAESFLFLGLLRCFSSPGSPPLRDSAGSPHWVSPFGHRWLFASAHDSPTLFAVYHVLLRHLTPRHPPCALLCFVACHTEKWTLLRVFAAQPSPDAAQL